MRLIIACVSFFILSSEGSILACNVGVILGVGLAITTETPEIVDEALSFYTINHMTERVELVDMLTKCVQVGDMGMFCIRYGYVLYKIWVGFVVCLHFIFLFYYHIILSIRFKTKQSPYDFLFFSAMAHGLELMTPSLQTHLQQSSSRPAIFRMPPWWCPTLHDQALLKGFIEGGVVL